MRARQLLPLLLLVACATEPEPDPRGAELAGRAQELLVRGVAHAEIDQWAEAIARFTEAIELGAADPVLFFNLAVAHSRNGELEAARGWADRVPDSAPAALRARVEYLRAKLALESGDVAGEAAAYRRAMALDPSEAAYPYSLAQVLPRLGDPEADAEVGVLLERAASLWPESSRLRAELAQWSLARPDPALRRRGLELVAELTPGDPRAEALVERGREELEADAGRAPVSLRRALVLLRPGKVFQTDSAALDARLALLPLAEPVGEELRRGEPAVRPAVTLEPAGLLPPLELEAGETLLAVRASNDAVGGPGDDPPQGAREADLAFLTDRRLRFLARAAESYSRIGEPAGARELLVGELDGDGRMEAVTLGEAGVALFGRGDDGAWARRALDPALESAALRGGLLVDFEHDGDLDLLAIGPDRRLRLATHRGEAGLGPPEPAPLDVPVVAGAVVSADLDGDVDQDLAVATPEGIRIFVNWRQGEYRPGQLLPVAGAVEGMLAFDYDGDARFDLVAVVDGKPALWRNRAGAGLERDQAAGDAVAEGLGGSGAARIDSLATADLDLDGALDLVAGQGAAGVALGGGRALSVVSRFDGLAEPAADLLALDLDGDSDPDLLAWSGEGVEALRAAGAEAQGRLEVALRGLKGKVPLDGRGARLDVWFGLERRSRELERPLAILGLGGRRAALVRVTWPNGISEYLFEPQPDSRQVIAQELRIEGSCPFLYAFDGRKMRFVTDILGMAPLGMLAAPDRYVPADPEEYLRLPEWVAREGSVELRITEELREVAYIDQVELVVVDAPSGVEVYNGERFFEGFVDGLDLRLLGPLAAPVSVRGGDGREALDLVAALDHRYLAHSEGDRLYQGAARPGRLVVEVPRRLAATGRVSLVLTGWLHWGNTSTNVARAQDPGGAPIFPRVEIPSPEGGWTELDIDHGLPAGKTKPVVVDLSGRLDPGDPRLAITTDFEVYWDRIAVAEALPIDSTPHRLHRLAPSRAQLSYGGFSRWHRPAPNGPYLFDYADRRPYPWRPTASGERAIAWQEHEGFYTPFGPVIDRVRSLDDRLAIFGSGEELAVAFDTTALPPLPAGWRRTLFLHTEGWEKDGDPNVACSQTVGPVPSRDMTEHPCPRTPEETESATRWVDRHRLERRVLAWSAAPR